MGRTWIIFAVLEPQITGSWHMHCLIRSNVGRLPFINNNSVIEPMWGQGFTKLKRLKASDNVAAYLMAYLGNVKYEVTDSETGKTSKKIVKGGRLHYYPKGVNIYRRSRGIKDPIKLRGNKASVLIANGLQLDAEADFAQYKKFKNKYGEDISIKFETFKHVMKKIDNDENDES